MRDLVEEEVFIKCVVNYAEEDSSHECAILSSTVGFLLTFGISLAFKFKMLTQIEAEVVRELHVECHLMRQMSFKKDCVENALRTRQNFSNLSCSIDIHNTT